MKDIHYGSIAFNNADSSYSGSHFKAVREAMFANPYQAIWGAKEAPALPVYDVSLASVLKGVLPFGQPWQFLKAAERTVDSAADLRWGDDGKGFRRLLHPNGVGLVGRWEIDVETPYSGYFKKGSQALLVGRYSTCCTETRRGHSRSLSLVGKLFPTTDANHPEALPTANFFTQQDLGGDYTAFINDVETRNAPDTTAWRRGAGLPILLLTGAVFLKADKEPGIRQLYEIAELDKPASEATQTPQFMRLTVAAGQPRIDGEALDFRDEVMAHIYDPGDATPKRQLVFNIEVADVGVTKGLPIFQRRLISAWRTIGKITFTEAVVSYNVDFVLHFNHPTWRNDRNDPASATRVAGRKVV